MSKDKSKKWVISAPLFYNYAGILEFLKIKKGLRGLVPLTPKTCAGFKLRGSGSKKGC